MLEWHIMHWNGELAVRESSCSCELSACSDRPSVQLAIQQNPLHPALFQCAFKSSISERVHQDKGLRCQHYGWHLALELRLSLQRHFVRLVNHAFSNIILQQ